MNTQTIEQAARALYTADLALMDDSDAFFSDMGEIARARQAKTFASSHAGRILAALKAHGRMTPHELHITGLTVVQVDRRLPDLKAAGLARVVTLDDGHPMTRNGARVWEAVDA